MADIVLSQEDLNAILTAVREIIRYAPPVAPVLYLSAAILARFAHKNIYLIYVMFFAATLIGGNPHRGGTYPPVPHAAAGALPTQCSGHCRAARPNYRNHVVSPRLRPLPSQQTGPAPAPRSRTLLPAFRGATRCVLPLIGAGPPTPEDQHCRCRWWAVAPMRKH
jgi:hypothetical protein